jgi:hypothetical protein
MSAWDTFKTSFAQQCINAETAMSEIKDGGPAFPASRMEQGSSPEAGAIGGYFEVQYSGMTLRDYFAAKALVALASSEVWLKGMDKAAAQAGIEFKDSLAFSSYRMADAMLRARSQS